MYAALKSSLLRPSIAFLRTAFGDLRYCAVIGHVIARRGAQSTKAQDVGQVLGIRDGCALRPEASYAQSI